MNMLSSCNSVHVNNNHLLITYYVSGAVLGSLWAFSSYALHKSCRAGCYHCLYFVDEDTEAEKGKVTRPKSYCHQGTEACLQLLGHLVWWRRQADLRSDSITVAPY